MSKWRLMDGAPKDGTRVLVNYISASGPRVTEAMWKQHGFNGRVKEYWYCEFGVIEPTHWIPLPSPPPEGL